MKTYLVSTLFLLLASRASAAVLPVCARTTAVKEFLERTLSKTCDAITDADLATVKRVAVNHKGITSFNPDDLTGLTSLEILNIRSNPYSELPEGLFRDLVRLKTIVIIDTPLKTYPADYLQFNSEIENLYTFRNQVTTISDAVLTRIENSAHLKEMEFDSTLDQPVEDRLQQKFPEGGPISLLFN